MNGLRFDVLLLLHLKENISCTLLTLSEELFKVNLETNHWRSCMSSTVQSFLGICAVSTGTSGVSGQSWPANGYLHGICFVKKNTAYLSSRKLHSFFIINIYGFKQRKRRYLCTVLQKYIEVHSTQTDKTRAFYIFSSCTTSRYQYCVVSKRVIGRFQIHIAQKPIIEV